jgi:osmotically-inducible protein OsmY
MQQKSLAERIEQRLRHEFSRSIVVAEEDGTLFLSGHVESEDARNRAQQIAVALAPDRRIDNNLDIERDVVEGTGGDTGLGDDNELDGDEASDADEDASLESSGIDDLDEVPLETDDNDVVDDTIYDDEPPVEPDPAYFAPTDPVIGSDQEGNVIVLGGWEPTSLSDQEVERSAEDNRPGDEALADAIRRELREDALTTDLQIDVQVENGVAHLRGRVAGLEDAEAAQEVASQVPGVRDVIDELDVADM